MTKKGKKAPEVIEDADLDKASGGLLPAVKEVKETTSSSTAKLDPQFRGGVFVAVGDING